MRLHLTIVTLKGQGHSDFEGLYLAKEQSCVTSKHQ